MTEPVLSVCLPVTPTPKGRPRAFKVGRGVRMRTPEKTRAAEHLVATYFRAYMRRSRLRPLEGSLRVRIVAVWPRLKATPKKTPGRIYKATKPDADNVAKLILDSLNGIAFGDDGQVVELHVEKWHAALGEDPCVEVRIWRVDT